MPIIDGKRIETTATPTRMPSSEIAFIRWMQFRKYLKWHRDEIVDLEPKRRYWKEFLG